MPSLLNYSTKVEAGRTAAEILGILARIGASRSSITYGPDQVPIGLEFVLTTDTGDMVFRLPSRVDGVYRILYDDWSNGKISGSFATRRHADRVAWRILKDWVEAQLALIQTRMVQPIEVFLPYALNGSGVTFFEAFVEQQKALPAGGGR